jgi:F1F0 ATPase subunit 2
MAANSFILIGAFLAGVLLGAVFFGGLWLTLRYTLSSALLGLWLVGSFVLRTSFVLAGFYAVFGGDWPRLPACLAGFVSAKFLMARLLSARGPDKRAAGGEASHAP